MRIYRSRRESPVPPSVLVGARGVSRGAGSSQEWEPIDLGWRSSRCLLSRVCDVRQASLRLDAVDRRRGEKDAMGVGDEIERGARG